MQKEKFIFLQTPLKKKRKEIPICILAYLLALSSRTNASKIAKNLP